MKKENLKKIITMGLIATSLIAVAPMQANAEWKQGSSIDPSGNVQHNGWYYTNSLESAFRFVPSYSFSLSKTYFLEYNLIGKVTCCPL